MILQSLYHLARREGLTHDPDFEHTQVHWRINLKLDGRFISFESLIQDYWGPGKRKTKIGFSTMVPRALPGDSPSGQKPDPRFLQGNASFILRLDLTKEKKYEKRPGELERRYESFLSLVREAAEATRDTGILAIHSFLKSAKDLGLARDEALKRFEERELIFTHRIAFSLEKDKYKFIHEHPAASEYWAKKRSQVAVSEQVRQCIITGMMSPIADKHPPIRGVPNTSTQPAIVSFNQSAFWSYSFERNNNAPVSREAAEAYTTGLNRLLSPNWPDPKDPNRKLPEQRIRLSSNSVAVFWTDSSNPIPAVVPGAVDRADKEELAALDIKIDWVQEDNQQAEMPEEVKRNNSDTIYDTYKAPWVGIRPEHLGDTTDFRILILSGDQGRIAIRSFYTSPVRSVVTAIRQWFEDLSLQGFPGRPYLRRFLRCLSVRGDLSKLPPNLAQDLFLAILAGKALPTRILEAAIRRSRSEPARRVTYERASIIKAALNRAKRAGHWLGHTDFEEVKPIMNEEERNRGYLLGRLFACVERMQELALGDVGASVTDRYFSAACSTPQTVFPKLLKMELHHYRKAREGNRAPSAHWLQLQMDRIASWLVGNANGMQEGEDIDSFLRRTAGKTIKGFPSFLPLAEQGLFVLGYHQQRSEFYKSHKGEDENSSNS